jgi:hypothetical protein
MKKLGQAGWNKLWLNEAANDAGQPKKSD